MKIETIALHHGHSPDATTKAVAVPIYQTVAYAFDNAQHGADLFDLKVAGNIYSRIMNPTVDVLEQRIAAMEGGVAALAVASGMSAITYAIQCICAAGNNIVSVSQLYGGTYNLFAHTFPKQGIETRFVSGDDFEGMEKAIDGNTRALFCESIGNPAGNVADLARLAEIAHKHGIPLIVDNTVPTPYLCRPLISAPTSSSTRSPNMSAARRVAVAGAIVDSGRFDWSAQKEKYPMLCEPDTSYRGVVYTKDFGPRCLHRPLPGGAAPQHGRRVVSAQRFPDTAGAGDTGTANGPALRKRAGGRQLFAPARQSEMGELRGLAGQSLQRIMPENYRWPGVRNSQFRH